MNTLQKNIFQLDGILNEIKSLFCMEGDGWKLKPGYYRPKTPEFQKWLKDSQMIIKDIFSEDSDYYKKFVEIDYGVDNWNEFQSGLLDAVDLLAKMSHEIAFNKS